MTIGSEEGWSKLKKAIVYHGGSVSDGTELPSGEGLMVWSKEGIDERITSRTAGVRF
jgi:hypothetical protein